MPTLQVPLDGQSLDPPPAPLARLSTDEWEKFIELLDRLNQLCEDFDDPSTTFKDINVLVSKVNDEIQGSNIASWHNGDFSRYKWAIFMHPDRVVSAARQRDSNDEELHEILGLQSNLISKTLGPYLKNQSQMPSTPRRPIRPPWNGELITKTHKDYQKIIAERVIRTYNNRASLSEAQASTELSRILTRSEQSIEGVNTRREFGVSKDLGKIHWPFIVSNWYSQRQIDENDQHYLKYVWLQGPLSLLNDPPTYVATSNPTREQVERAYRMLWPESETMLADDQAAQSGSAPASSTPSAPAQSTPPPPAPNRSASIPPVTAPPGPTRSPPVQPAPASWGPTNHQGAASQSQPPVSNSLPMWTALQSHQNLMPSYGLQLSQRAGNSHQSIHLPVFKQASTANIRPGYSMAGDQILAMDKGDLSSRATRRYIVHVGEQYYQIKTEAEVGGKRVFLQCKDLAAVLPIQRSSWELHRQIQAQREENEDLEADVTLLWVATHPQMKTNAYRLPVMLCCVRVAQQTCVMGRSLLGQLIGKRLADTLVLQSVSPPNCLEVNDLWDALEMIQPNIRRTPRFALPPLPQSEPYTVDNYQSQGPLQLPYSTLESQNFAAAFNPNSAPSVRHGNPNVHVAATYDARPTLPNHMGNTTTGSRQDITTQSTRFIPASQSALNGAQGGSNTAQAPSQQGAIMDLQDTVMRDFPTATQTTSTGIQGAQPAMQPTIQPVAQSITQPSSQPPPQLSTDLAATQSTTQSSTQPPPQTTTPPPPQTTTQPPPQITTQPPPPQITTQPPPEITTQPAASTSLVPLTTFTNYQPRVDHDEESP